MCGIDVKWRESNASLVELAFRNCENGIKRTTYPRRRCLSGGSTSLMAESMEVLETNGWDKSELVVGVYATNKNE